MKKLLSIFLLVSVAFTAIGQDFPKKPATPKLVNDFANILSAGQVSSLEQKLVAFDNQTSNQVTVVILKTTGGYNITDYATELGRKWGIGNQQNNGVLLLVAIGDRKLTIVPGYGLEGALPDAVCQAIIDHEITPSFKRGDFGGGISKGTDAIMKATEGAYKAPEGYSKRGKKGKDGGGGFMFIIILVVVVLILSRGGGGGGGRGRGYRGMGGFPVIFPGGGGGGWTGGGGRGGGGFGGFGGGSFGGGGASGSW